LARLQSAEKPERGAKMGSTQEKNALRLWTGATYRICVQGKLDKRYSDLLGGLTITQATGDDDAPVTILYGWLVDQAALLGVLNALYDSYHLPLLLVECVDI
jgi:hypothetical protein